MEGKLEKILKNIDGFVMLIDNDGIVRWCCSSAMEFFDIEYYFGLKLNDLENLHINNDWRKQGWTDKVLFESVDRCIPLTMKSVYDNDMGLYILWFIHRKTPESLANPQTKALDYDNKKYSGNLQQMVEQFKVQQVQNALVKNKENKTKTAKELEISRQYLYKLLEKIDM